jgi:hypothetical protein
MHPDKKWTLRFIRFPDPIFQPTLCCLETFKIFSKTFLIMVMAGDGVKLKGLKPSLQA